MTAQTAGAKPGTSPEQHPVLRFVRALYASVGSQLTSATMLLVLVALSESAGIMLLLPLLHLAGVADTGTAQRFEALVQSALHALGLQPTLAVVLVLYVVTMTLQALLQRAATIREYKVESDFSCDLKLRTYRALTYASWRTLVGARKTDVAHALANEADRAGAAAAHVVYLISQTLLIVIYASLALAISPALTGVTLLLGGVMLMATRSSATRATQAGEEVTRAAAAASKTASEHISALKVARAEGLENNQFLVFQRIAQRASNAHRAAGAVFARLRVESTLVSVIALAGVAYIALAILHIGAASLLLLLFVFARLAPRISSARETWQMLRAEIPAYDFVNNVIESLAPNGLQAQSQTQAQQTQPQHAQTQETQAHTNAHAKGPAKSHAHTHARAEGPPPHPNSGTARGESIAGSAIKLTGVRLDNVTFSYDRAAHVLSNANLYIPGNGVTAITGESGAGKTTLADIVGGLLTADAGTVLVNDEPLEGELLHAWHDSIGYVSQEPVLFDDTVRANLVWARPRADDEALNRALSLANATGLVQSLPQGLDTRLGDRGALLSGGERQRLSLARALLREPALLILDEPTSALDMRNERRILRTVRRIAQSTAVLLITHRVSALRFADRVYVLEDGTLTERAQPSRIVRARVS